MAFFRQHPMQMHFHIGHPRRLPVYLFSCPAFGFSFFNLSLGLGQPINDTHSQSFSISWSCHFNLEAVAVLAHAFSHRYTRTHSVFQLKNAICTTYTIFTYSHINIFYFTFLYAAKTRLLYYFLKVYDFKSSVFNSNYMRMLIN